MPRAGASASDERRAEEGARPESGEESVPMSENSPLATREPPRVPALVRLSLAAAILGTLVCLPLLIKETPYTFVAFMFLGQPLLLIAFALFAWKVFQDLRGKQLI
jgi:hypothetical protein